MFPEDLLPFMNPDEFAVKATLDGVAVVGLLDSGFDNATLDGFSAVGSSPRFTLSAASAPTRTEGKALVIASGIGAGTYKVGNAYPDGTGLLTLHLIT